MCPVGGLFLFIVIVIIIINIVTELRQNRYGTIAIASRRTAGAVI